MEGHVHHQLAVVDVGVDLLEIAVNEEVRNISYLRDIKRRACLYSVI